MTTMNLYELADECDVLSFDNYPVNVTLEHLYGNDIGHPFDPAMTSFAMQIIRGGKSRPIWVPEAQIGRTALTQKEIVKEGYPRLWNHGTILPEGLEIFQKNRRLDLAFPYNPGVTFAPSTKMTA